MAKHRDGLETLCFWWVLSWFQKCLNTYIGHITDGRRWRKVDAGDVDVRLKLIVVGQETKAPDILRIKMPKSSCNSKSCIRSTKKKKKKTDSKKHPLQSSGLMGYHNSSIVTGNHRPMKLILKHHRKTPTQYRKIHTLTFKIKISNKNKSAPIHSWFWFKIVNIYNLFNSVSLLLWIRIFFILNLFSEFHSWIWACWVSESFWVGWVYYCEVSILI